MSLTIGWFTTAEDARSHRLFTKTYQAMQSSGLDLNIAYLFCNRQKGEYPESDRFLASVQDLGLNLITCSSQEFQESNSLQRDKSEAENYLPDWQTEYHRQVMEKIRDYPVDIILLVDYVPMVSVEFVKTYTTIRFRAALPDGPSGSWSTVIWQLIGTRVAESGATMHLLTEDDPERGVPISYCNYFIKKKEFALFWRDLDQKMRSQSLHQLMVTEGENNPLFNAIKEAGEEFESSLIFLTTRDLGSQVIRLDNGQAYRDDELLASGYCMTEDIETFLIEQEEGEEGCSEEEDERI